MSEISADSLDYPLVVAEFFLALRGLGLVLSPLDQDLVSEWEKKGVPVSVVCRGIRNGMEHFEEEGTSRPPRSLRGLRGFVEEEWRAYQSGRVGAAPGPSGEAERAKERLLSARTHLEEAIHGATPELSAAYLAALHTLIGEDVRSGSPLERVARTLAAADAAMLTAFVASLPRAERVALGARVRLLAGARRQGTTPRAHRETLRAHLLDLARAAGMNPLSGSV